MLNNVQVHGSEKKVLAKRRQVKGHFLQDQMEEQRKKDENGSTLKQVVSAGPGRVVLFAISMNGLDCIFKFGGAYLTNSKSLLAEGFHSMMDTVNQVWFLKSLQ